jgi:hypothetical protein
MLEDYLSTKNTRYIVWGAAGIVLALLMAHAALAVSSHRDEDRPAYHQKNMFFSVMPAPGKAYIEGSHGAVGTISGLNLPRFTLVSRGGATHSVYVGTSTLITPAPGTVTTTDALQNGTVVMVIGNPRTMNGEKVIDALIIRILPSTPPKK